MFTRPLDSMPYAPVRPPVGLKAAVRRQAVRLHAAEFVLAVLLL